MAATGARSSWVTRRVNWARTSSSSRSFALAWASSAFESFQILTPRFTLGIGRTQLLVEIAHVLGARLQAGQGVLELVAERLEFLAPQLAFGIGRTQLLVEFAHMAGAHLLAIIGALQFGVGGVKVGALVSKPLTGAA